PPPAFLAPGAAEAGPMMAAPVVAVAPVQPQVADPGAMVGAAIGAQLVTCTRCHGVCEASMGFCKYCGAALAPQRAAPRMIAQSPYVPAPGPVPMPAPAPTPTPPPATTERLSVPPPIKTGTFVPLAGGEVAAAGRLVVISKDGAEGPSYPLSAEQV